MNESKNSGILPFVLGLLSTILAFSWASAPYVGLVLGIAGLILSVNGRKTDTGSLMTAAFVLSIIGIAITGIELILWLSCLGFASSIAHSATRLIPWWL